jgi:hypothetical protein
LIRLFIMSIKFHSLWFMFILPNQFQNQSHLSLFLSHESSCLLKIITLDSLLHSPSTLQNHNQGLHFHKIMTIFCIFKIIPTYPNHTITITISHTITTLQMNNCFSKLA